MKLVKLLLFFLIIILLPCCQSEEKLWIDTQNQLKFFNITPDDNGLTYKWDGGSFDKVINGEGVLSIYNDGKLIEEKTVNAYYGAIDPNDIINSTEGDQFIGNLQDQDLDGFGVLIKTSKDIFIGYFKDSKPNGDLNWYRNGKLYYSGKWKDGSFNGKGTLYKEDGSVRKGTWSNGNLIQAYTKVQLPTGLYEGFVLNGKPDGLGTMNYKDGSYYRGNWQLGKWNGNGIYKSITDSIAGDWVNGKLSGDVTIKSDRFIYSGECTNNMADGQGDLTLPNSTLYSGEWADGKMNGYGDITFPNSDYYYGDWNNNNFDGYGSYVFSKSGDYYNGEWKDGQQNGLGTYHSNKYEYNGNWEQGWINGQGRIVYANKDFYEGNFVENEPYGNGYYHFSNGNSYNGEFVNGKFNGLGTFYFANGSVYEGEFQNGKIKGDGTLYLVEGKERIAITANWNGSHNFPKTASILFNNGDLYEGELINGHPTKNGVWTSINERSSASSKISQSINQANEFYKRHRDSWNNIVIVTSTALSIVEVAAPIAGGIMVATGVGAPVGAALIVAGQVAGIANVALNVADASIAIASAGVDTYNDINDGKDATGSVTSLGKEVAINAAFIFAPKILKKVPARKLLVPLSKAAKSTTRRTVIILSKNNTFRKVVAITKNKAGILEKRLSPTSVYNIAKHSNGAPKFKSAYLASRIAKSALFSELKAIQKKGPIKLSEKDLRQLLENPNYIRQTIAAYTGTDSRHFQEFFIRLAMGDKKQVKLILENDAIKLYVKKSIRGNNHVHEWLETQNFESFLLDDKWGDDGAYLALALTKFVQRTDRVLFKNGRGHVSTSFKNSRESVEFHRGLDRIIENCSSKEELFIEIKRYAKNNLTKESYDEFRMIFGDVFS